jgi:hypothetical protein
MKTISKEKREELITKIQPLLEQVEAWRRERRPNEHMPESLWAPATELAKVYGLAPVQGILRIDYRGLQRRVSGIRIPSHPQKPAARFVELPALTPARRSEQVVELEDGAGRKMVLKVCGGSLAEIVPLVQAFWRP